MQSPWPDSDILVDGQVAQVRGGIFHVGLSEGRLHEITPTENLRARSFGFAVVFLFSLPFCSHKYQ